MHSDACCDKGAALPAELDAYITAPRLKTYLDAGANDLACRLRLNSEQPAPGWFLGMVATLL
jgi:hypothetical protein